MLLASLLLWPSLLLGLWLAITVPVYAQTEYTIDSDKSFIRVITDKAGIAAAQAHQHLISINQLGGKVNYIGDGLGHAKFTIRPDEFTVDDVSGRGLYPKIFTKSVSSKAISGTRENMLGARLLDAVNFPAIDIDIRLTSLNGELAHYQATVIIKGRPIKLSIPGSLTFHDNTLIAKANFNLANPDLGLDIFSALFAAISVGHDLKFIVEVVASRPTTP